MISTPFLRFHSLTSLLLTADLYATLKHPVLTNADHSSFNKIVFKTRHISTNSTFLRSFVVRPYSINHSTIRLCKFPTSIPLIILPIAQKLAYYPLYAYFPFKSVSREIHQHDFYISTLISISIRKMKNTFAIPPVVFEITQNILFYRITMRLCHLHSLKNTDEWSMNTSTHIEINSHTNRCLCQLSCRPCNRPKDVISSHVDAHMPSSFFEKTLMSGVSI